MNLSREQAALVAALLRPRVQLLTDLLADQVQALPPGETGWADTADELAAARDALAQMEGIR